VEDGAILQNCVCWDGVRVGSGVRVRDSIVGHDVRIEAGQEIADRVLSNE
jgi:NDP-sugar pyrophosphorylase family protein